MSNGLLHLGQESGKGDEIISSTVCQLVVNLTWNSNMVLFLNLIMTAPPPCTIRNHGLKNKWSPAVATGLREVTTRPASEAPRKVITCSQLRWVCLQQSAMKTARLTCSEEPLLQPALAERPVLQTHQPPVYQQNQKPLDFGKITIPLQPPPPWPYWACKDKTLQGHELVQRWSDSQMGNRPRPLSPWTPPLCWARRDF